MFVQCKAQPKRSFKTFTKLDAVAMEWIRKHKSCIIEMHTKKYAGREYIFVNYFVTLS